MSAPRKRWLIGIGMTLGIVVAAGFVAASMLARRFEPMIREQAIRYLQDRFQTDVELAALRIHVPKLSVIDVLRKRGRGTKVEVDGEGLSMRRRGMPGEPPLFSIRKVGFIVDLGTVNDATKTVDSVSIEGMEIHVPPKGERPAEEKGRSGGAGMNVEIKRVHISDALLVIAPRDKTRKPLQFQIAHLRLQSVGRNTPMAYDALLTIPKPPGQIHSKGSFGPWAADEPGDSPLTGNYVFEHADLGIFSGIAGILTSSGTFEGTLDAVHARGEASVPDFRLKMSGNRVPLWTHFEVLVDGTNGDTVLQPVRARLGSTSFTTTGAVIKHEGERRRAISLKVAMPNGDIRDLLTLATKGAPFMEGRITLDTRIDIPPLSGPVKDKLLLDGRFALRDAKFLRSNIQDQLDQLSRRGQGKPKNEQIDQVVSNMRGSFRLQNQVMTFRSLDFGVPGAHVALAGEYNLDQDTLDFHGNLKLMARLSDTMTGWKRWVLKPVDPFFAKNGAGTFLHIKVDGTARQPKFGLDRGRRPEGEAARVIE